MTTPELFTPTGERLADGSSAGGFGVVVLPFDHNTESLSRTAPEAVTPMG
jgi:hypothetical protein